MSMCACGSDSSHARSTPPAPSKAKTISRVVIRSAPRAKRRRRSSSASRSASRSASATSSVALFLSAEDPLGLPVGQPLPAADDRAVEGRLARVEAPVERHLDGQAEPVLVRAQAAEIVGELGREHRRDTAGDVRRERAPRRAAVERRAGRDEMRDVGDVHPGAQPVAFVPHRDRVVEVLRRLGVDRERELVAQVDPALERRRGQVVRLVLLDQPLLLEQGLEHAVDRVGGPERFLEPRAALARRDDRELAGPNLGEAAPVEHERHARA